MRLVRYRTTDLTRLALVTRIVDRVVRGELDVRAADVELAEAVEPTILTRAGWPPSVGPGWPPRWRCCSGAAADLADRVRGHAFIDRLGRLLGRWGVPPFFLQIVGGFVATVSTLALFAIDALPPTTEPSLVIAASITVLLSGFSLMGAVQDAISGHRHRGRPYGRDRLALRGAADGRDPGTEGGPRVRAQPGPGRDGRRRRHPVRDLDVAAAARP